MLLYPFSMAKVCELALFQRHRYAFFLSAHTFILNVLNGFLGYRHEPFQHCPQGESHKRGKCWCDSSQNFGEHKQTT